jgi:phosphatidylserine/phosphatidylglycerophosphate/cardiolipin synthase-like enzyme
VVAKLHIMQDTNGSNGANGEITSDSKATNERILKWCQSKDTVSSIYAQEPEKSPGEIAEKLWKSHHLKSPSTKSVTTRKHATAEDLAWARSCGDFANTQPSELFLRAYHDLLQCLDHDALANCVSPPLCGSTGFVPLTIIGQLNDQARHMSNLIVRAKREVLLATNFWKHSKASDLIHDAMIELSNRAGSQGEKVVFKLMYDRGDVKQFLSNHQKVDEKHWTADVVGLPPSSKIPNLDFEVINFHRPPLGTFHSKFMVVDREIATISSNNIMDNDNTEMMSHIEGPIVDSVWETFLISWHNQLDPPAPCRDTTARAKPPPTFQEASFKNLFEANGAFRVPEKPLDADLPEHDPGNPHYDSTISAEIDRMRSVLRPREDESHADAVARHLNKPLNNDLRATAPARQPDLHYFPFIPAPPTDAVPIAMASRKPYADLNNHSEFVPQNECFLSLIRNAQRSVFIQTPDLNARPLLPTIVEAVKRGVEVTYYVCLGYNDLGELLPGQGGTNEMAARTMYEQLDTSEEKERLKVYFYVAADQGHPIHNSFKKRSCHIKLLIVDDQVTVQGSGNQDTQSYFHSQEVNVMIDSPTVCKAWREGIERNQNTREFGRVREDGCWYDKDGKLAEGSMGTNPGKLDRIKGAYGMIQKARGA